MSTVDFSELFDLPVNERLRLASALWESIVDNPESLELTDSERKILDERMESYMKNPTEGRSWSEIKSELLAR